MGRGPPASARFIDKVSLYCWPVQAQATNALTRTSQGIKKPRDVPPPNSYHHYYGAISDSSECPGQTPESLDAILGFLATPIAGRFHFFASRTFNTAGRYHAGKKNRRIEEDRRSLAKIL